MTGKFQSKNGRAEGFAFITKRNPRATRREIAPEGGNQQGEA